MEDNTSQALDIMLANNFINNGDGDRQLFLTLRLVCRELRRGFSDHITAATLHTPADVRLAANYFPSTPQQRQPWRSVEDSQVFPSLRTLKVSDSLVSQLYSDSSLRQLLASTRKLDVDMTICEAGHVSQLHLFGGIVSSLRFLWSGGLDLLESFLSAANVAALVGLTKLAISGGNVSRIQPLTVLSMLSTLQHLQLSNLPITNEAELISCFSTCALISQLTRLDVVCNVKTTYYKGHIEEIKRILDESAPRALRDFSIWLYAGIHILEEQVRDECLVQLCWTDGVLKVNSCTGSSVLYHQNRNFDVWLEGGVSRQFEIAAHHNVSAQQLTVNFVPRSSILSSGRFLIDLTKAACLDKLALTLDERKDDCWRAADIIVPNFEIQPGLQMAASRFELEIQNQHPLDVANMVIKLPELFPNLQHLKLSTRRQGFENPDVFSQLTKLTHLTVQIDCWDTICLPFSLMSFPPSLKELEVHADDLQLAPLAGLEHLTKLALWKKRSAGSCTVDALYGCGAPLRDLSLQGLQIQTDLPALAAAFPRLETLDVHLGYVDVSPLSSLQLLKRLAVHLPNSDAAVRMGTDTLTNLASLTVGNASDCLDGLSNLATLVHLRYLEYSMGKCSDENSFHQLLPLLQLQMPHTRIKLCVRSRELKI